MSIRYRMAIAAGFVGAVVVAAAAFGQTGTPSPSPSQNGAKGRGHKIERNLVHSESKIQVEGGFATLITDVGEVTGVSGSQVTIRRADGETVTVTAGEDTRIRRNGEEAQASALRTGDRAHIVQMVRDGTTTVRAIRAFSEDFQPKDRPGRGRGRLRRGPPGAPPAENAPPAEAALFTA